MIFHDVFVFLLIVPILLIFLLLVFSKNKKNASLQFSSLAQFKKLNKGLRERFAHLPLILKVISFIFIVVALARPQTMDTKIKKNIEGIDIVIALDVSDSMLIEDMKPVSRIEAAKDTIRRFVKARTSDRIGLIIFAGEAFTLVPLTLDYDLILKRVDEITTAREAHIADGTAIGVALANAASRLKDSTAKSRVMIFATDGESNTGTIDPETGLEIAKGYGIKIYSIGIGRDGPTKIPIYRKDVFGNKVKTYEPFESTVNEDLLSRMAKDTGGKYYRASQEDSLQTVFAEIDKLEKTKIDINKYTRYNEVFQRYVFFAILFYLAAWFISSTWLRRGP